MSLIRPLDAPVKLAVDTGSVGWKYLGFELRRLSATETFALTRADQELAIIPIEGSAIIEAGDHSYELSRRGVFTDVGSLLYVPPQTPVRMTATTDFEFALGSAPARGGYPLRLVSAEEIKVELRGGGNALRQVHHVLAPPLPAERLISYEVFLPGGSWAGWPPHRHDGVDGSPYLEEIYYFLFDRPDGFGFHRNYDDSGYDEVFVVRNGDCVVVPKGFHVTTSSPGNNMWILNFLAGDLLGEERSRGPHFDPTTTWICDDWSKGRMELPFNPPHRGSE
jgi:5-deoxy-glucuronate isomerase